MRSRWLRDLWWFVLDHSWSARHLLARLGWERLEFIWPTIARRLPRRLRHWVILTAIADAHLPGSFVSVEGITALQLLEQTRKRQ